MTEEFSGIRVFLFFSWITDLESIYICVYFFFVNRCQYDYIFPQAHILGNIREVLLGENMMEEF